MYMLNLMPVPFQKLRFFSSLCIDLYIFCHIPIYTAAVLDICSVKNGYI
jgi:hypothetical protein